MQVIELSDVLASNTSPYGPNLPFEEDINAF
jgi:hypothetical protein